MTNSYNKKLILLFFIIILSRFISIFIFPLADTTEARYAHIALLMANTDDWITPYFDYDVPFWGKPPLSFWMQALSYKIFGVYDFVPRIPSLLATVATAGLIYKALFYTDKTTALLAMVIYVSIGLVYILSGAVLTDPYLVFATTLSLVSFVMIINSQQKYWDYLFFIGLGLGMLAKGPLAVVIVFGIITLWVMFSFKKRVKIVLLLPWFNGIILTLLISIPWYLIAEIKTPGFLQYFIIGEHFNRFIDPGWKGDLYGHAHQKTHGQIWIMWLYSSLPWGLTGLIILLKHLSKKVNINKITVELKDDKIFFYTVWMLFIMLFFTMAGNTIETYLLPSLPPLAILLALYFNKHAEASSKKKRRLIYFLALFGPALAMIITVYIALYPTTLKTEKFLINKVKSLKKSDEKLYFVGDQSFSTKYYFSKKITPISFTDFSNLIKTDKSNFYFIITKDNTNYVPDFDKIKNIKKIFSSQKCLLYFKKGLF